jgi:glycosyltransferase involved in cell wall biosynthesis
MSSDVFPDDFTSELLGSCVPVDLSVVIPLYDEEENLESVMTELLGVLDGLDRSAEVVLVDDGSRDATADRAFEWHARDPRVNVIQFRRNFGQTAAINAGFRHARGRVVVPMDGDQQNDPHDIPVLLAKLDEGYEVVSGWRRDRKDGFLLRRVPSRVANGLISRITGTHLHDYGCTLKAYDAEVVEYLHLYGGLHRFIPALAAIAGARIAEVPVNHRPRARGRSKYGISRTLSVLLDLVTIKFLHKYFERPMQLFGRLGLASFAAGSVTFAFLVWQKYVDGQGISGRPLLTFAAVATLISVQLFAMGFLGEYLARIYYEGGNRTPYVVRRTAACPERTPDGRP